MRFVIIKCDVLHAHLGYDVIPIQRKLTSVASVINEMSRKIISLIDVIHCITK